MQRGVALPCLFPPALAMRMSKYCVSERLAQRLAGSQLIFKVDSPFLSLLQPLFHPLRSLRQVRSVGPSEEGKSNENEIHAMDL